jgi:hypothetical protein
MVFGGMPAGSRGFGTPGSGKEAAVQARFFRVAWCAPMLVGALAAAPAFGAVALLPHHAVYKLTLASSQGSKAPADANGMISYDFTGSACKGYTTVFRQVTAIEPPEGETRLSNTDTTTVESGSGSTFDFDIKTSGSQDTDDVKGEAAKAGDGSIEIRLEQPESAKVDVKATALFPTEHLARIIETARSGGKLVSTPVFDGSDTGRKVMNTLTVIGAPISSPAAEKPAQDDALKGERRWPVTISYFDESATDAQPAYVLSFDLYENGVSRALRVNNGNFVLAGELVEFKPMPAAPCSP